MLSVYKPVLIQLPSIWWYINLCDVHVVMDSEFERQLSGFTPFLRALDILWTLTEQCQANRASDNIRYNMGAHYNECHMNAKHSTVDCVQNKQMTIGLV